MRGYRSSRGALRDALLDVEEVLSDLRAALTALSLISSTSGGIEEDEMSGLRYVTARAREHADDLHRSWRDAARRLGSRSGPGG